MKTTPVKDLLKSLYRKHKQILNNCYTRRDSMYAEGYRNALDDVLNGLLAIQADEFESKLENLRESS